MKLFIFLVLLFFVSCSDANDGDNKECSSDNPTGFCSDGKVCKKGTCMEKNVETDEALASIERKIPSSLGKLNKKFVKYTKIVAPNGKAIHILAQDKISDEKMLRAKNILEFYLTNYEGSKYGNNKDSIRNEIANKEAKLLLLNGSDEDNGSDLDGQPLYENEIQIEGGPWYTKQDYEHRDASYEEILHFVHDNGIGVDGEEGSDGVLKNSYQLEIREAQKNASEQKIWTPESDSYKEWKEENSLTQEYLASVVDAYYGLWGAWQPTGEEESDADKSMWGFYKPKVRKDMSKKDPKGLEIMVNKFFHPYITYNARIDKNFKGTFTLKFDSKIPYTHHSRNLKDITLLGSNDINVKVNELNNYITGNSGRNIVIFSGASNEYTIGTDFKKGTISVKDKKSNRDGENILKKVEELKFSDKSIILGENTDKP